MLHSKLLFIELDVLSGVARVENEYRQESIIGGPKFVFVNERSILIMVFLLLFKNTLFNTKG
jgi:hypothetical protein